MDVVGRYIGIWVSTDEMEAIFGFDPVSDASVFMIRGKVVGETDDVGLWIELERVSAPPDENIFPDIPVQKPIRLIRWEFVHSAELFDKQEDMRGTADFRPQLAA